MGFLLWLELFSRLVFMRLTGDSQLENLKDSQIWRLEN